MDEKIPYYNYSLIISKGGSVECLSKLTLMSMLS